MISMQSFMMTLALSFITLIAVFSIGAVMFTVTLQKKREIGVMKALGATPAQVTNVFALQGVIVGLVGSLTGVGLSLLVLNNLSVLQDVMRSFGFDPFSKAFYGGDLPYEINSNEMVYVCVGAFVLCSLAAYAPAWMASRADAARSLRSL
jgi:lipoprotein-releasing system permease protein